MPLPSANEYTRGDIIVENGVNLDDDPSSTMQWTDSQWFRFVRSYPQLVGGYVIQPFDGDSTNLPLDSSPFRSIHSQVVSDDIGYIYGGASGIYYAIGAVSNFSNITPLSGTTTAIADSLDTHFLSLGSDPINTTDTSTTVVIDATGIGDILEVGDLFVIASATATNGIGTGDLNATHIVRAITADTVTITVNTAATSTGSGGGASATLGTAVITVNATANGLRSGERIAIAAATAVGGIPDTEINAEHIIRNASTNAFDIVVATEATSAVTGGGGASTTFEPQIDDGEVDAITGSGYGGGNYGSGAYGLNPSFTNPTQPRLWFYAPFGNNVVITAGNGSVMYEWDFDTDNAPTQLADADAPIDVDYIFTSQGYAIALRGNIIQWSDSGDYTEWTQNTTTFAGQEQKYESNDFISHAETRGGTILLFSDIDTYSMRYNGRQESVWDIEFLARCGIASPYCRAVDKSGVAYWWDGRKFYRYNGMVEEINCSLRQYSENSLNFIQRYKSFAWYNDKFDEVWFHIPNKNATTSDRDDEPYEVFRLNVQDLTFSYDNTDRAVDGWTAAEQKRRGQNHILANFTYPTLMESGINAVNVSGTARPLNGRLLTPWFSPYSDSTTISQIYPSSVQEGTCKLTAYARRYVQDATTESPIQEFDFTGESSYMALVPALQGVYWRYLVQVQNNEANKSANWRSGRWRQSIANGPPED